MANVTGASLNPIFERLRNAPTYHPLEADTFADWSIEAGDLVTVTRDGRSYQSPVHSTKINWNKKQKVTISSTGNEKRDSVSKMSQRKFRGGSSGLRNSQNSYRLIETSYNNMRAGLELASSSAALYVDDSYRRMRAGLNLTSSSAALYVDDSYRKMRAGLALTSSSAALYVDDSYNKMRSGLSLTSSSAALYVDNKYSQMKSGLDLTSSSAALYVDNKYNQMRAGLNLTSSSATLYAQSRTTRAYIMTRINANGEGEAIIDAQKVSITGATTIGGTFEISSSGYLHVKKMIFCDGNIALSAADGTISAHEINANGTNGFLRLWGGASAHYDLNYSLLGSLVSDASVSGNTLTLTKVNGDTITFNKAVTPTLSGSWSNGKLTVTSNPAAQANYERLLQIGAATRDGTTLTMPISAVWGSSGQYSEDTGTSASVNISSYFNSISITRVGWHSKSGNVYYGKLYYYDDDVEEYEPVYTGNAYWYRSGSNKSGTTTVYY